MSRKEVWREDKESVTEPGKGHEKEATKSQKELEGQWGVSPQNQGEKQGKDGGSDEEDKAWEVLFALAARSAWEFQRSFQWNRGGRNQMSVM